jgi:hypothetical protein
MTPSTFVNELERPALICTDGSVAAGAGVATGAAGAAIAGTAGAGVTGAVMAVVSVFLASQFFED